MLERLNIKGKGQQAIGKGVAGKRLTLSQFQANMILGEVKYESIGVCYHTVYFHH